MYICVGTTVKSPCGRTGHVISVDRENKIAVVSANTRVFTEKINNLKVASYREVE